MEQKTALPSNKNFGLFFTVVLFFSGAYFLFYHLYKIGLLLITFSIIFLLVSIFSPNIFLTLNKFWMKIGFVLGKIVNPIVLGLIYFVLFSPISITMKFFKRDELFLNFKKKPSYWRSLDKTNLSGKKDFKNQF